MPRTSMEARKLAMALFYDYRDTPGGLSRDRAMAVLFDFIGDLPAELEYARHVPVVRSPPSCDQARYMY